MAANIPDDNLKLPARWKGFAPILLAVGAVCVLLSLGICYLGNGDDTELASSIFFRSYLANFMFCLSISLGALFFVMIQHLVRAGWSASIRRLAELFAFTLPWWALLFLPILAMVIFSNSGVLYPWNYPSDPELPAIVKSKIGPFLNPQYFTMRVIVYFAVWILAARWYFSQSRKQDETGDTSLTLKQQRWAGPMIMLFALSVNFGAFDIMMSTDPAWFSTIYGVYLFAASMLSFFAAMIVTCYLLQRSGRVEKLINVEHFHDLAKFQFGFIVFWGYIAFSQFLLYWYGNIPEETTWYKHRMEHGWEYIGLLLIGCHFAIPFLGTMPRYVRRSKGIMFGWACFILVVHWLDMLFLLLPTEDISVTAVLLIGHLVCWVGMMSLFVGLFIYRVGDTPVVAIRDPWLPDALAHQVGP